MAFSDGVIRAYALPAEQILLLQLMVKGVTVSEQGLDVQMHADGLYSLMSELQGEAIRVDEVALASTNADPVALAIAKGFRWQELLDNGTYPTVRALAKAVKQDTAYVARTIRLTLLAPEIIEAVMAGQCPPALALKRLSREFPMVWGKQQYLFNMLTTPSSLIF